MAEDVGKVKGKHKNMNKPWEDDAADHWKVQPFGEGDMAQPLLEESSFAVLFPAYREKYLRDIWPQVTAVLKKVDISCKLDLIEGSMTVATTRKTWDPFIILKTRDMIKLLSRSVALSQALKVLNDNIACDIIKIGTLCRNKERFIKRRERLLGPNGSTLKAIELLTQCYVMIQGNTVSVMGPHAGLKQVRKLVEDCFKNYHPVYHIKAMMIKRELEKDPLLKNESWDRFLPQFRKKNVKRAKKATVVKKEYTPFPPAPMPRKVDEQLESGEYFLSESQKQARHQSARTAKQVEGSAASAEARKDRLKPPKEKKRKVGVDPEASRSERSASEVAAAFVDKSKKAKRPKA